MSDSNHNNPLTDRSTTRTTGPTLTSLRDEARKLTQAERSARSDKRMFQAAMNLISQQGAHRTTLKDICEQAGYSRGLANYRFGSKDDFLQALLSHFNHAWEHHLASHVGSHTGKQAFFKAVDALESFLVEHQAYMRGGYIIWYEHIGGENLVHQKLKDNHAAYRRDTAQWIGQAISAGEVSTTVDADFFATFYLSFVFGTIFQWLASPSAIDLPTYFAEFRKQAANMLGCTAVS